MLAILLLFWQFPLSITDNPELIPYRSGDLYGYATTGGTVVIPPQFSKPLLFGDQQYLSTEIDGWPWLINRRGERLVQTQNCPLPMYDSSRELKQCSRPFVHHPTAPPITELLALDQDTLLHLLNKTGKIVYSFRQNQRIPYGVYPGYEYVFREGVAVGQLEDGDYVVVDTIGAELVRTPFPIRRIGQQEVAWQSGGGTVIIFNHHTRAQIELPHAAVQYTLGDRYYVVSGGRHYTSKLRAFIWQNANYVGEQLQLSLPGIESVKPHLEVVDEKGRAVTSEIYHEVRPVGEDHAVLRNEEGEYLYHLHRWKRILGPKSSILLAGGREIVDNPALRSGGTARRTADYCNINRASCLATDSMSVVNSREWISYSDAGGVGLLNIKSGKQIEGVYDRLHITIRPGRFLASKNGRWAVMDGRETALGPGWVEGLAAIDACPPRNDLFVIVENGKFGVYDFSAMCYLILPHLDELRYNSGERPYFEGKRDNQSLIYDLTGGQRSSYFEIPTQSIFKKIAKPATRTQSVISKEKSPITIPPIYRGWREVVVNNTTYVIGFTDVGTNLLDKQGEVIRAFKGGRLKKLNADYFLFEKGETAILFRPNGPELNVRMKSDSTFSPWTYQLQDGSYYVVATAVGKAQANVYNHEGKVQFIWPGNQKHPRVHKSDFRSECLPRSSRSKAVRDLFFIEDVEDATVGPDDKSARRGTFMSAIDGRIYADE